MHNGVVLGTGSNPVDAIGGPSMAATGQDAVGAVRDAESLSELAAFAEEDGYLGSDHESAQRSIRSAAPEGTDFFAQIYDSKVSDNRSWFLKSHG
jgi:hypothetical protein